jgi:hypothetical protein
MSVVFQSEKPERVIFHFNRQSNIDPTVPMWIVKHKGQTHYVNNLDATIGFRTKNTPENDSTKGSLQFNKANLRIETGDDGDVTAHIY